MTTVSLYIGGLPYELREDQLWSVFTEFGGLQAVTVLRDSLTGRSRGIGFAHLSHTGSLCAIEALDQAELLGRRWSVSNPHVPAYSPDAESPKRAVSKRAAASSERDSDVFSRRVLKSTQVTPEPIIEFTRQAARVLVERLQEQPEDVYTIHPRNFEIAMAEIFRSFGANVELTPYERDGGYDLLVTFTDTMGFKSVWVVECKRYAKDRPIGVSQINGIVGNPKVIRENAKPVLVTTSSFTAGAVSIASSAYNIQLKDIGDIKAWLDAYRPPQFIVNC